jgi:hypothetical protein
VEVKAVISLEELYLNINRAFVFAEERNLGLRGSST